MDKKAQIQELISLGKTEEALELLEQLTTDAILLQSRFNGAKRQYSMGMIDFSEWSRTQAQINYAALEMMNGVKEGGTKTEEKGIDEKKPQDEKISIQSHSVFISYNHGDSESVNRIENYLEKKGVQIVRDTKDMLVGEKIEGFIQRVMKERGFILSVVSANSLSSGWVGLENDLAFYSTLFGGRQFIPIMLDSEVLKDDFLYTVVESIDTKLADLETKRLKSISLNLPDDNLIPKRKRLENLRQNLPKIITRLQEVLTIDVSGKGFNSGMEKVVKSIKG